MYKETITYTDYNGDERTEDFYFNLTETEISMLQLGTEGGLREKLERITKSNDKPEMIKFFQELISLTYGEKSLDGRRFIKNPELSKAFFETEAYNIFFMKLATDSTTALNFLNGIVPKTLRDEMPSDLTKLIPQN